MIFEACLETLEEAINAQQNGAHRIELCSHLEMDGLTPSPELLQKVCSSVKIPVMVMIRPRAGNFVYSGEELKQMERDIEMVRKFEIEGIVIGLLTTDNQIDIVNTQRLTKAAKPLQVTFHKAVDLLENPLEGVKQLMNIQGITRILTSGGKATAKEGASKIREMVAASTYKITILVAGKVTDKNIAEIGKLTGAAEFHGKRIVGQL